jgi:hypothetical protein
VANLELDANGVVNGTVRVIMTGPDALRWRQQALENDPEEIKKQFNESFRDQVPEGVQAEFDHFLGLDDPAINLIGFVKLTGTLGSATGKRFFLPGLFFDSRGSHPFVAQDKRIAPIDVHYADLIQDDVTYNLPPGFTVESAPQSTNLTWPDHAALKIRSAAKDGSVEVACALIHNYAMLDQKNYQDLHDFYLKAANADQQQIVLTRAPAAKGN